MEAERQLKMQPKESPWPNEGTWLTHVPVARHFLLINECYVAWIYHLKVVGIEKEMDMPRRKLGGERREGKLYRSGATLGVSAE